MSALEHPFVHSILAGASDAAQLFGETELPIARDEDWRFSNTRGLYGMRFVGKSAEADAGIAVLAESQNSHALTSNGKMISYIGSGFEIGPLSSLSAASQAMVKDHIGNVAPWDDAFSRLNSWLTDEVICVVVPPKTVVEDPIHLAHWASGNGASGIRTIIVAGRESQFTIVEDFRGEGAYFRNAVTECVIGANAHVTHIRAQEESPKAAHILRTGVRLTEAAHYDSYTVSVGAVWSRHDLMARHEGVGAFCRIDGLVLASGEQTSDTHSTIDNTKEHCESHQLHKSIVGGKGHSIFNGKILVQKGAQKIDAYQLNRSLLLSRTARVDTKPQLEILADDVRCTHGATIGQLDEDQLFYLRSRGFDADAARGMLTYAFAGEILEQIKVPELRARLEAVAHSHIH